MVEITINGEKKYLEKELNVKEMIEFLGYEDNSFAVAINSTFVSIKEYENKKIKNGDMIDILAPMVGG